MTLSACFATMQGCEPPRVDATNIADSTPDDGTSGASTTTGTSTTTDAATTDPIADVGSPDPQPEGFECDNPEFRCDAPLGPSVAGNGLGAIDTRGCLRIRCDWSDACETDEICIVGEAWGECVPAVSSCDEVDGTCRCIAGGICNAAYCAAIVELPFEVRDVIEGPADHARWQVGCSPEGHPTTTITLGLDEPSCTATASGPSLEIRFLGAVPDSPNSSFEQVFGQDADHPLLLGSAFDADGNGAFDDAAIAGGVIRLTGPSTGRYELVHDGLLIYGQFSEAVSCPVRTACE